ncbi:hypothetical protein [Actinopolyspora mortivallis]|uniref:WXG100 family type VII secretion target n=1 Tax=Actinopolyspora mortivallis TaxID=33906 RepID=A0A2T0GXN2_ACTMO|nr:hypothetical protein [Actinopolyspora mortivallis]PRW63879.1 hypothetical protein CEP50_07840 [Actinopolyspora mortivallis]
MAFEDADDPLGKLDVEIKDAPGGLKAAIEGASWQVQGVNWIYEQVTGQNLVESLISPITGDFAKISQNAEAWNAIGESLRSIRRNINHGSTDLQQSWEGEAAAAFEAMMVGTWTVALEADAALADLVAMAFTKAADASQKLCSKILELLTKLVNRLIQAACTAWIPVGGWANAVRIVIQCIDLVFMILDMIESFRQMYEGVVQVVEGVKSTGTSLASIKEIVSGGGPRGTGDAVNALLDETSELRSSVSGVTDGVTQVRDGATQVREGGSQARQDAAQVRSEAARTYSEIRGNGGDPPAEATQETGSSPENGTSGYRTAMSGNL